MTNLSLNIFLYSLFLTCFTAYSQEVHYFNEDWEICDKKNATYYRHVTSNADGNFIVHDYYMNGQIQMNGIYEDKNLEFKTGKFEYFNKQGDTSSVVFYQKNMKQGEERFFFENGDIESIALFENGKKNGKFVQFYEGGSVRSEAQFEAGNIRGIAKRFYPNGNIGGQFELDEFGTGTYITFYETGEKYCEGFYRKGYAADNWTNFDKSGEIITIRYIEEADIHERLLHSIEIEQDKKRKTAFKNQVFRDNAVYDFLSGREIPMDTPISTNEEIIEFPDVEASFPNGVLAMQQFIADNVHYPTKAIKKNIGTRAYISFVVEPDGSLSNITYQLGHKLFEKESIRLVKSMPRWIPGEAKGKKVRTRCRLPINYTLN